MKRSKLLIFLTVLAVIIVLADFNPATAQETVEDQYWELVKDSADVEDFKSYLKEYPDGKYAALARLKINQPARQPTDGPITETRANNLLTPNSVGDIRIGMTIGAVRKFFPDATFQQYDYIEEEISVEVMKGQRTLFRFTTDQKNLTRDDEGRVPIDDSAKIESIEFYDSRYKTADGVHIGMTIRDAAQRFGKITKIELWEYDGSEHAEFSNAPKSFSFTISPEKGSADDAKAGIYGRNQYSTDRYSPNAVISTIKISRVDNGEPKNNDTSYSLTPNSAGDVRIGMTVAEARKVLRGAVFSLGTGCEEMPEITVIQDDKVIMKLVMPDLESSIDENAEIGNIVVYDSRYKTARGLQTGMTLGEVEKNIGRIELWFGDLRICPGEVGSFKEKSSYTFEVKAKNGQAGIYHESRATTRYNPDAYISGIRLSGIK